LERIFKIMNRTAGNEELLLDQVPNLLCSGDW
jgi:hypothetical protein